MGEGHRIIIDLLQPDPSYLAVQWLFRKLLAGVYLLANFLHHLELILEKICRGKPNQFFEVQRGEFHS